MFYTFLCIIVFLCCSLCFVYINFRDLAGRFTSRHICHQRAKISLKMEIKFTKKYSDLKKADSIQILQVTTYEALVAYGDPAKEKKFFFLDLDGILHSFYNQ